MKIYQIDTFTDKIFSGNPAAVVPLNNWIEDEILLNIASENNLSETVFYVKKAEKYEIRWFTPIQEVDLCGHATLAAAYVLFNHKNHFSDKINFYSPRSGDLSVTKNGDWLTLNFPTDKYEEVPVSKELTNCFNITPNKAFKGKTDYMLVYETQDQIQNIIPDFNKIAQIDARGIIVTAKGINCDFVSRFFGPAVGINEDPVTGSAHTLLTPYWSKILEKNELSAIQLSKRTGYLKCQNLNKRVEISGQAVLYLLGELFFE